MIDPPKRSVFDEVPGKAPKRLREMTSNPNIAARERDAAVGVDGTEFLPVRNLKRPY